MRMLRITTNGNTLRLYVGFIATIVLIVVALLALGWYGFDLQGYIDSPAARENLAYALETGAHIWSEFVITPAFFLWDQIQGILP